MLGMSREEIMLVIGNKMSFYISELVTMREKQHEIEQQNKKYLAKLADFENQNETKNRTIKMLGEKVEEMKFEFEKYRADPKRKIFYTFLVTFMVLFIFAVGFLLYKYSGKIVEYLEYPSRYKACYSWIELVKAFSIVLGYWICMAI